MAAVKGHDEVRSEPLGEDRDGSVGAAEWEVGVAQDELRDRRPVVRHGRLNLNGRKAPEEGRFDLGTEAPTDEVRHLGDDKGGDDEVKI